MFDLYEKNGTKVTVNTCTDKKEYLASGHYFEKDPTNQEYLMSPSRCEYVNENFKGKNNKKLKEVESLPEEPVVKSKTKKRKGF